MSYSNFDCCFDLAKQSSHFLCPWLTVLFFGILQLSKMVCIAKRMDAIELCVHAPPIVDGCMLVVGKNADSIKRFFAALGMHAIVGEPPIACYMHPSELVVHSHTSLIEMQNLRFEKGIFDAHLNID